MKKTIRNIIWVLLLLKLAACSNSTLYEESVEIPLSGWPVGQNAQFEIQIHNTESIYQVWLQLRHTTDYSYSNIFFFLHTRFPDDRWRHDTLEIILARPDGTWIGKGWGDLKSHEILINPELVVQDTGLYVLRFEQAMRQENLKGITDIGLRIEKTE